MIDQGFFIQTGDTVKYLMQVVCQDFEMSRDDFFVVLHWGILGESKTVRKADMPCDEDGNWYLIFDSAGMAGRVVAECHYFVNDLDMESGEREEIDRQVIGLATDSPCPAIACKPCTPQAGGQVTYTRVYRSDVHTLYLNLRTVNEEPIVDVDGKQLRVRKEQKDIF